jgi:uncharacterized protein (DUF983 family)
MRDGVSVGKALWRGLQRKCPCCGQAPAFRGYLKIVDACSACQTPLSIYPTDDGPAYITIILVGHVIIAPAFMFGFFYAYPVQVLVPVMVGSIGALTLMTLPYIKGAFLGLMWCLGLKQAR